METMPGELSEIHRRLNVGEDRMKNIEADLAANTALTIENTALTRDIKELLDAAKMGLKVIGGLGTAFKWAGGIAAAATAIYTFIYVLTHGNIPK